MARVRESTIDHPLAARIARGLEDKTAFQAGLTVNTGWTGQMRALLRSFGGANQISDTLACSCSRSKQTGCDDMWHASSTVTLLGQSKWIHD